MSGQLSEERVPLGYELLAVVATEAEAQIMCSSLRNPFYCRTSTGSYRVYQHEQQWPQLRCGTSWLQQQQQQK